MKKYLYLFVSFFICIICTAQTAYEVTANPVLNVRSYGKAKAPLLGKVYYNDTVQVYEISNGWAKIKYNDDYAYVSAKYLKEIEIIEEATQPTEESFFSMITSKGSSSLLMFLIIVFSIILFMLRMHRKDDPLEGGAYIANMIIFILLSAIEIIYVISMKNDSTWFCSPNKVGWIWTIINFFIFGYAVFNQIMCFFETLDEIAYNSYGSFDKTLGIFSWAGAAALGLLSTFLFPVALPFIGGAFVICQIIQIVLIFRGIVPDGGWLRAILCVFVYIIGSISTVLILIHFIALLIVALIVFVVLAIFSQSDTKTRKCRNCHYYRGNSYCDYYNNYIDGSLDDSCNNHSF
ncbi:MAG: SH3 domain-containing protein [Muribaculaceae bacterium]|nr:SH3 domain-containing protein [Muribaculaceae bacterium]